MCSTLFIPSHCLSLKTNCGSLGWQIVNYNPLTSFCYLSVFKEWHIQVSLVLNSCHQNPISSVTRLFPLAVEHLFLLKAQLMLTPHVECTIHQVLWGAAVPNPGEMLAFFSWNSQPREGDSTSWQCSQTGRIVTRHVGCGGLEWRNSLRGRWGGVCKSVCECAQGSQVLGSSVLLCLLHAGKAFAVELCQPSAWPGILVL